MAAPARKTGAIVKGGIRLGQPRGIIPGAGAAQIQRRFASFRFI
jgi:hypothetical protein